MENETTQPDSVNESPKYNPMSIGDWIITNLIVRKGTLFGILAHNNKKWEFL